MSDSPNDNSDDNSDDNPDDDFGGMVVSQYGANPMDSLHDFDTVSLRAVVVRDGQDPGAALAEAGIFDPIAVAMEFDDDLGASGHLLGDGITPNLTAVLEMDAPEPSDAGFDMPMGQPQDPSGSMSAPETGFDPGVSTITTRLPAAFGMQPLAPVRRRV